MNVDLQIEELILHHCAPGDRERVGAAVLREVEKLIAERGLARSLAKGADIARIDAGGFEAERGNLADNIGAHIAQAAYGSVLHD